MSEGCSHCVCLCVFFFNDTATTEIYTLSLHDALPILSPSLPGRPNPALPLACVTASGDAVHGQTGDLQLLSMFVRRKVPRIRPDELHADIMPAPPDGDSGSSLLSGTYRNYELPGCLFLYSGECEKGAVWRKSA